MNFWRALRYFLREAMTGLRRSWRVSLLAVATMSVSLYLAGTLLLVAGNLAGAVADWQREARLIVYLRTDASPEALVDLRQRLAALPAAALREVSAADAAERFRRHFPSLSELADSAGPQALPASFELEIAAVERQHPALAAAIEELRRHAAVALVDDDRDWLAEATRLLNLVRGVGVALSLLLLGAAVFTVASVVRLVAYLHREEIAVLRLVGATEFFLRGPFYTEGLLQGLAGGLLALAALWATYLGLVVPRLAGSLTATLVAGRFLTLPEQLLLPAVGAAAGLAGAALSLGRAARAAAS